MAARMILTMPYHIPADVIAAAHSQIMRVLLSADVAQHSVFCGRCITRYRVTRLVVCPRAALRTMGTLNIPFIPPTQEDREPGLVFRSQGKIFVLG